LFRQNRSRSIAEETGEEGSLLGTLNIAAMAAPVGVTEGSKDDPIQPATFQPDASALRADADVDALPVLRFETFLAPGASHERSASISVAGV
jgi:hypothetical protein